ncbi:YcaO-like family protein [Amycolatopsis marina]|uniref:YcaO-like family protein n=1 Tax=Amycolatopsis marina TaxID=490629 RepID=UPI0015A523D9|nr:YcaO-like family protein [Amycolatopsis marina]
MRDRSPEDTWEFVRPRMREYGVTRIAELTGLDIIGMPVYMAVRPLATTVGVSQGKGATPLLARLSAVMEAIEMSVCERYFTTPDAFVAQAVELDLPYATSETTPTERSIISDRFPLRWVPAVSLADGEPTFVPLRSVAMDGVSDGTWRPSTQFCSANGLASGNTLAEATIHALLEVIERYSTAGVAKTPIRQRKVLDLRTLPDCWSRDLVEHLHDIDFWVEVVDCSVVPGVSAFAVFLWHPDMPSLYAGSGSHFLPEIAVQRALTEAVQSRMSVISGTREDIGSVSYRGVRRPVPPLPVEPNHSWNAIPTPPVDASVPSADMLAWLVDQVSVMSGRPVLRVDMTPPGEPFAVCKVVAPGLPELLHEANEELPRHPDPEDTQPRPTSTHPHDSGEGAS